MPTTHLPFRSLVRGSHTFSPAASAPPRIVARPAWAAHNVCSACAWPTPMDPMRGRSVDPRPAPRRRLPLGGFHDGAFDLCRPQVGRVDRTARIRGQAAPASGKLRTEGAICPTRARRADASTCAMGPRAILGGSCSRTPLRARICHVCDGGTESSTHRTRPRGGRYGPGWWRLARGREAPGTTRRTSERHEGGPRVAAPQKTRPLTVILAAEGHHHLMINDTQRVERERH